MPKDRGVRSLSFDGSRASPYPCNSRNADRLKTKVPSVPDGDQKEWEEARCPICMDHPHNAVLLLCSSGDKGCRPYMCDTSNCHSNCLGQYQKSSAVATSTEEVPSIRRNQRGGEEQLSSQSSRFCGKQQPKLVCPLCRGEINGWVVIEPACQFMNSKARSCSLETCDFSGNYSELRRHARHEHPGVYPSKADPRRLQDWMRLERERDFEDFLSAYQLESGGRLERERDFEDFLSAYQLEFEGESSDDDILNERAWMSMEHERDLEGLFDEMYPENENENIDLLMSNEFEALGTIFSLSHLIETNMFSDSRDGVGSYNRGSTRSRTANHTTTLPDARHGTNVLSGRSQHLSDLQQGLPRTNRRL